MLVHCSVCVYCIWYCIIYVITPTSLYVAGHMVHEHAQFELVFALTHKLLYLLVDWLVEVVD